MKTDQSIAMEDWAAAGEPFRLVAVEIGAAPWAAVLPAEGRERMARFSEGAARARAGASEWLKQCWLPGVLGLERVGFAAGPNGKPLLQGAAAEWGFNVSHAGTVAVAVLVRGAAVGVDVEWTARKADTRRLADRVFSASEQTQVRNGDRAAFFTLWSQKEALMKALGCGWADGQIQRRTALVPGAYQREPATGAQIWSRRVRGGAYALAVAVVDT